MATLFKLANHFEQLNEVMKINENTIGDAVEKINKITKKEINYYIINLTKNKNIVLDFLIKKERIFAILCVTETSKDGTSQKIISETEKEITRGDTEFLIYEMINIENGKDSNLIESFKS